MITVEVRPGFRLQNSRRERKQPEMPNHLAVMLPGYPRKGDELTLKDYPDRSFQVVKLIWREADYPIVVIL